MIEEVRGLVDRNAAWVRDKCILIQAVLAVNKPSRDLAEALAFMWVDTREARPPAAKLYALLNDDNRPPATGFEDALRNYDIVPVLWGHRDDVRGDLAA